MRFYVLAVMALALGACTPTVPESGNDGVGFDNYTSYEQQRGARESQLQGQAVPSGGAVSNESITATTPTQTQQTPPPAQTRVAGNNANSNNPSISDEQDFGAVSSRESIESDRVRLEQQRSQYVQIQPTAVPTRSGSGGPNVVEYALSTSNRVGEAIYRRSKVFAQSRYNRNCQKYPSPDLAQIAFLKSGGPRKDGKGLDPDGDGFACSWDPQPFRNAKLRR